MKLNMGETNKIHRGEALGSKISRVKIKDLYGSIRTYVTNKIILLIFLSAAIFIITSQGAYAISLTANAASPDTDTQISLNWTSAPGAEIYELYRDDGTGTAVMLTKIDVDTAYNSLSYIDSGLLPESEYTYTIRAFDRSQLLIPLESTITTAVTTKMISPYDIKAVYDINFKTVAISWQNSTQATGCTINCIKADNTVTTYPAATLASSSITLNELDPVQITVVAAGDNGLLSEPSMPVVVTPVQAPQITASLTDTYISVYWASFPQIGHFQLERSRWNSVSSSWDAWEIASTSLSDQSIKDWPPVSGKYRYRLAAKSGSDYSGYSNISESVNRVVGPSNLTLTIIDNQMINLTWANAPGNESTPVIRLKIGNESEVTISNSLSSSTVSYSDNVNIIPGVTYKYTVGYEFAPGNFVITEQSITANLPNAPLSLHANVASSTGITLNWTDNSNNESGFRVERMTDSGAFTEIGTSAQNIATYTDNTVSAGYAYIYRIRSYNALGNSTYSNEVTINPGDSIAPATLTVIPVSAARLDLAWSYTGTTGYNTIIERKTGTDGSWSVIFTTAQGTLKYSDSGLSPNTRYFYRIRKYLGTGASGISYPNNEIGIGACTYLGSLSLSGSAASGNTIYLSWTGNTGSSDVIIERKMSNGSFNALTTVSSSTTGWYDNTGLVPSASYTYRVKARNSTNESVYSNELTVQNFYLNAPSGLGVSVDTDSAILLKWIDNSIDERGFEIWRCTYGSSTYALYATVDKNITTYTDVSIQTGVQYNYMVRAYVASGGQYSSYSNSASVGVGLINPPTNLYYTYISKSQVSLKWTDASDNESGFKVERKIGLDGEWNVFAWLSSNVTAYTASNLDPFIKYYFRVRAYSYTGNADSVSSEIMVTTLTPTAPSEVTATALSSSQVKITWKDNSDSEEGFKIMRKSANAYYFQPLAEVGKNITTYSDSNLTAGMRYYYQIVSYNATGSSESSEVEVKTNARATFSDLGSVASWAKDAIENLAGMGITKGATQTLYKPNNKVSKAEFTAMVVRAFKFDTAPVGSIADVKSNKWYYKEIMIAENFGIVAGDDKNKFYPEAAITREEIAVMLFKALEASGKEYTGHDNSALEKFTDRNMISPHAMASMATLVGEGIIEGLSGSTIGPKYTATRAQAAVFLYRALNR